MGDSARNRTNRLIALLLVGVVASGCGAVVEQAAEAVMEQSVEAQGGSVDFELGGGDLPSGLVTPVPDGYTVVSGSSFGTDAGSLSMVTVTYPAGDVAGVVDFYDRSFRGRSGMVSEQWSSDGASNWLWGTEDGTLVVGLRHTPGEALATLTINETTGDA